MKKFKKTLKGMTLIEIIVALAVFAMLGAILVAAGSAIDAQMKNANKVNEKVALQGPVAEAQNEKKANEWEKDILISVRIDGKTVTAQGDLYGIDDEATINGAKGINGDKLTFKFVKFDDSVSPSTTVPGTT